ncbi:hypothetical protein ig2599ANME_0020 [groundwater metagenome]
MPEKATFNYIDNDPLVLVTLIIAFYQDEGDVLIGRNVIYEYSITFDGRNSRLTVQ